MTKRRTGAQRQALLQRKEDELTSLRAAIHRAKNPNLIRKIKSQKSKLRREIEQLKRLL
jgi:hypothetical protein